MYCIVFFHFCSDSHSVSLSDVLPTRAMPLCRSLHPDALHTTVSEGLAQDPYVAARAGFEPIVIVISRFLERPQKRSRRNQIIHRRLTKTKSIGSGQDPESQAGRQTVRRLWGMVLGVETGREVWGWR